MPIIKGSWDSFKVVSHCPLYKQLPTSYTDVLHLDPSLLQPGMKPVAAYFKPQRSPGLSWAACHRGTGRLPSCPLRRQAPSSAFCQARGPGLLAVLVRAPGDVAGWPPFTHEDVRAYSASRGIARQGPKTNTLRLLLFSCVFGNTGRLPIICFILLRPPNPTGSFSHGQSL